MNCAVINRVNKRTCAFENELLISRAAGERALMKMQDVSMRDISEIVLHTVPLRKFVNPSTLKPCPQNTAHYGSKAQTLEGEEKGLEDRAGPLAQPPTPRRTPEHPELLP